MEEMKTKEEKEAKNIMKELKLINEIEEGVHKMAHSLD